MAHPVDMFIAPMKASATFGLLAMQAFEAGLRSQTAVSRAMLGLTQDALPKSAPQPKATAAPAPKEAVKAAKKPAAKSKTAAPKSPKPAKKSAAKVQA